MSVNKEPLEMAGKPQRVNFVLFCAKEPVPLGDPHLICVTHTAEAS